MDVGFVLVGLSFVEEDSDAIMLVSLVFWRLEDDDDDDDDVGFIDTDVGEVWSGALARGREGVDMVLLSFWTS